MAYDFSEAKQKSGVNVAECLRVADEIERSKRFDMFNVFHDCGTPACIAGHVAAANGFVFDPRAELKVRNVAAMWFARDVLCLQAQQAADLFSTSSDVFGVGISDANCLAIDEDDQAAHAAACLRNLAATGEVDWLGTKPDAAKGETL